MNSSGNPRLCVQRGNYRVRASARLRLMQLQGEPPQDGSGEDRARLERAIVALCAESYRVLLSLAVQPKKQVVQQVCGVTSGSVSQLAAPPEPLQNSILEVLGGGSSERRISR